ncbi:outer membrane protein assembly factor BamA [Labilibaculum sp. A4]|uniref:Outer membrane protein assembly factor BamA n=1 Tax=Labilibaculum euxinus TaxID=2686357 RepID=A0A425YCB2_9BACT|nr:outer membrane protein assembly factor BamA [Labilibaculum euxinus]MDQ1769659.1 outer membrane protein assembly factor BamA [Labilibaculum euxinus]MUP36628.1 outer membrane protein assembly factor BamA [Labilibaculum euxinus]MVB05833.1 outer membrane protein assembly factor BamA [Labilibaculum euxinus]MWN76216.1 outer membrane protein assembly factor BamA [Labilibaculum euxinus]
MIKRLTFIFTLFLSFSALAQETDTIYNPVTHYSSPKSYELGGVTVTGVKHLENNVLVQISGLRVGTTIEVPGEKVTNAINKLYKQGLFSDIQITATKEIGNKIYLNIQLQERPRLSLVNYNGTSKSETTKLKEKLKLMKGTQVTDYLVTNIKTIVEGYFKEKGFYNTSVSVIQRDDSAEENSVILDINIDRNNKIKIKHIFVEGNTAFTDKKVKKAIKDSKEKTFRNFLKSSKYIEEKWNEDKLTLIEKYNEKGYRDALVLSDSIEQVSEDRVNIHVKVKEGNQYFFNNIDWVGNTVYTGYWLQRVLGIKKGDVYNQTLLDKRLSSDDDAVSNQYLDKGYLFFNVNPVETVIGKDSINLEMRIVEGKQATIDRVNIIGNTKTHEHVARRELYTYPGELFSKSDIIRSVRELAQLGHFDPETISPDVKPHPESGTVDINYKLEEKANDQIELSGGWGAGMIIGTVGLKFSNFSIRNMFNKEAWSPLPTGDGQTLSIRAQTNGSYYNSYSMSFTEPWLGGKKPTSLSTSIYYSQQTGYSRSYSRNYSYGAGMNGNSDQSQKVFGASVGLARRLKWPDNYFSLYNEVSYQNYRLKDWQYYLIANGTSNNFSFTTTLSRSSIDNPLYTRRGSSFSLSVKVTPPYSLFDNINYSRLTTSDRDNQKRYKWIEYHKWVFKGKMYTSLLNSTDKLVLYTGTEFGYLGYFNKDKRSPFEGFEVGGDGMSGYSMYGSDNIGLRGYENGSLTPVSANGRRLGGNIYSKFTAEVRYPLSLSQSATIYALAFAEAGNAYYDFEQFQPFNLKRSAGVGLRIFLPMFGLLGIDYGYGFDEANQAGQNGGQFHFVIGQQF